VSGPLFSMAKSFPGTRKDPYRPTTPANFKNPLRVNSVYDMVRMLHLMLLDAQYSPNYINQLSINGESISSGKFSHARALALYS
jgi:hypothetical protein